MRAAIVLAVMLAGCAAAGPEKARSPADYCASGPQDLAFKVAERLRDYVKIDEAGAWGVVRTSHADVLRAAPAEERYMRRTVALVYEHPELEPRATSKAVEQACMRERWAER